ncbi:hypothetical protein [Halomonas sp. GD1P12]|uniref:hypothetical protein n=1 Tax=Halomonas sp. GD1P12 TaxID=2982691 RepID=UPI0021E3B12B|nr:hypothetical protein [Halomonas sp. GD1P12]UYF98868.1 hypothetical protein OCT39_11585 [Halomonas sp. GD1P12]
MSIDPWDTELPERLALLHQLSFDIEEGYDFEPYTRFLTAEDTAQWLQAWSGNPHATGAQFRVFGQDGTGGYAAFWMVLPQTPIEQQPIVFLGSEGESGVIARDLDDFLWLLAGGVGPREALDYPHVSATPNAAFQAFAHQHAHSREQSVFEVIDNAHLTYPGFTEELERLCHPE